MEDRQIIEQFSELKSAICIQTKMLTELKSEFKELKATIAQEHDKTLSLELDTANVKDDILELRGTAKECKVNCERRKDDFNRKVDERIEAKVNLNSNKIEKWIMRGLNVVLTAMVSYMLVNFILNPTKEHIQTQTKTEIRK